MHVCANSQLIQKQKTFKPIKNSSVILLNELCAYACKQVEGGTENP